MSPDAPNAPDASEIPELIDRLRSGDSQARDRLIVFAWRALEVHARRCLRADPRLHRWELTSDVLQDLALRLTQAIDRIRFETARHFLNVGAEIIRKHLIDLRRHYFGPQGIGANHASDPADRGGQALPERQATPQDPLETLALHELVERLPPDRREALNLLHYFRYKQAEAAALLGVTGRTVQYRYADALDSLRRWLNEPRDPV